MRPALAPLLLLTLTLSTCTAAPGSAPDDSGDVANPASVATVATSAEQVVVLETSEGTIVIRLYAADAPRTVANFTRLVHEGFYDSLTFHRVVPGFVIQGGDPNSKDGNPFNDGQGGPGYTVPAEIKRKHERGAVAMARMPDVKNPTRASSGSQFYITLRDRPDLDGAYTVFGKVLNGWVAIERLVALATRKDIARVNDNANPGKLALIQQARLEPLADWVRKLEPARSAESAPNPPVLPAATMTKADTLQR